MARRKQPPTARLRRLAAELRQLRAAAGHTRETVEDKTGINTASLYRIETARVRPQKRTLYALLEFYGIPDGPERDLLVELTRDVPQLGWLEFGRSELPEGYQTFISFETEADRIHNYESLFVPGLLQTEAYTRALFEGLLQDDSDNRAERGVETRARRQALFTAKQSIQLWAILDEAAIHRTVGGPEVMNTQLDHLVRAARSPTITLQVLPFSAGAHPGMPGSFVLMDFPDDDPSLVCADAASGVLFLETEATVARYRTTFRRLAAQALDPAETIALITRKRSSPWT
ncbi:helix-turn-helix domain-containing protein [Actinoplanes sp. NPDC051494]|uniref:helix-turn-helix domain-containing protein n=1 Tax=Actinoplanes sp. NPDC051494 TaxID=3363907 RepID=UPI003791FF8D